MNIHLESAIKQYKVNKFRNPEAVNLFRLGDFYEALFEDAETVCKVAGITVTHRDIGEKDKMPIAGMSVYASDAIIGKLVKAGYRVAICEQPLLLKETK